MSRISVKIRGKPKNTSDHFLDRDFQNYPWSPLFSTVQLEGHHSKAEICLRLKKNKQCVEGQRN